MLGKKKEYKLVCCTILNSIFIREDLFQPEFFPDLPVEALFDYSECNQSIISAFYKRKWVRERACFQKPRKLFKIVRKINKIRSYFIRNTTRAWARSVLL